MHDRSSPTVDGPAPAVRRGVVSRPYLLRRLSSAARVTLVSAPTGSGKTVLLRSWMADSGLSRSCAWVQVQAGELDPQRFWISVLDALRDTAAGSKLVRELTAAPDLDGWVVAEQLLTNLDGLEQPLWLVIDDVHELRSREMLRQLELVIMRAPSELRFVLATRRDLRLGLHRLRLEGELTEIRAADLRFTIDETRELLAADGVTLPDRAVARLHARTEGWAAGLRLAALSLAGHPDPERFAAEFSGTERTVAEHLLAEVLGQQSKEVRQLLLRTSVLERVCGPLADLLSEGHGGERTLQDLEETGAFVVSLDGERSWFRYHRLLGDLLKLELRRTEPDRLPALHRAAAGWYAGHGYPVEAVRHAQQAQDWGLAARVLSGHFLGLMLDGQGGTAHELLASFPADVVAADAELGVLMGTDELFHGSLEAADHHLARAARGMASVPAERSGRFQVGLAILRLSLAQRRGDLPAVAEEAKRLLAPGEAGLPGEPAASVCGDMAGEQRALALVTLGTAELGALRVGEAERHLEEGAALARWIDRPWLEVSGLAHAAWAASFRSFALAEERSMEAIKLARENGWAQEPVVAVAYTTLGAIRVWQMRLEDAQEQLEHAERALRAEADPAAGLVFQQARGMLLLARGRDADALAAFRTAEKLASLLVPAHPRSTSMRALLLQALVRLGESADTIADLIDVEETERGEMRVALAVLLLAQGNPRAATAALRPVLDGTAPVTNHGWEIQAFLLGAIARDELGDQEAAGQALEHALGLAEPAGTMLPFLLHPAAQLLQRHAREGTSHAALISEILDLLAGKQQAAMPSEPGRTRVPLSRSETRLLRYLPTNLSAPEIAAEMIVSVNTIRTHTRHLYEKLGVHSRTEAVERARSFGLLAPSRRRPGADLATGAVLTRA